MGKLSTHILDTALGKPAANVRIDLLRQTPTGFQLLKTVTTNPDGRTNEPLLEGPALTPGTYQLLFHIADYHRAQNSPDAGKFLDQVQIAFVISDPTEKYHVPLLVSPWSYSTYRGS